MRVQSLDQGRSPEGGNGNSFQYSCLGNPMDRLQSIGLQKVGHVCRNLAHIRHPLIKLFHLSNLLQMPNDHRMVDAEFFSNFVCSYKRISSNDDLQLVIINFQSSRLFTPLQNFLNRHCTVCSLVVPGPNALLMLQAVSAALWPILNSNKKIT